MAKVQSVFTAIVGFFETIVLIASAVCIIALAALVSAEIIMRNLGHSMVIVEELCFIMLGWTAFLAAAYTFRKRGHISISFFFDKLPMAGRKILHLVTSAAIIVFFCYIFHKSLGITTRQMLIPLTQSRLPRGYIFMGLPVGTAFSIFFMLADLAETYIFRNPSALATEEEKQMIEIEAGRRQAEVLAKDFVRTGD